MKIEEKIKALEKLVGEDLIMFGNKHNYKNIDILNNKIDKETEQILDSCKHNMDKRSSLDYAKEIMINWILEDFIIDKLDKIYNVIVKRNGIDKKRAFVSGNKVTTDADVYVMEILNTDWDFKDYYLEVVADFDNFWSKKGVLHLRDNKLNNLIKKSRFENVFLLAVDIQSGKAGFIKIDKNMERRYVEIHKGFGGKPAWEIDVDTNSFIDINNMQIKIAS